MSAKLTSRQVGDVTVIDAAGRITLGDGASSFRDTIRDLAAKGNKNLLQITKLYTVFEVFDDETTAIRSFH
jgi:hypothetical protein